MAGLACLICAEISSAQESDASLVIYISPDEYSHETKLGLLPYYMVWARKGPALEQAAKNAFQPHFREVTMCEGSNSGDTVVWLKSQLNYNPSVQTYYAKVAARFYRADGKFIGKLEATGTQDGLIGSQLTESQVQQIFTKAMQDISRQYAAESALHQAIDHNVAQSPCAMVALLPRS
jgi:hypothetical protein